MLMLRVFTLWLMIAALPAQAQVQPPIAPLPVLDLERGCKVTGTKIFAAINDCMNYILGTITDAALRGIIGQIGVIILGIMTLAVIFMGIKIIHERAYKGNWGSALMLRWFIRIAVITAFTFGFWLLSYRGILMNLGEAASTLIWPLFDTSGRDIWQSLDLLLNRLLGYIKDPASFAGEEKIVLGFAIVGAGLAATGPLGAIVLAFLLSTMFAILMAFTRALVMFVIAKFVVVFMIIVSPITIPLYLFKGLPRQIFERWVSFLINFILQPVVLVGFLAIMWTTLNGITNELMTLYTEAWRIVKDPNINKSVNIHQPGVAVIPPANPNLRNTSPAFQFMWRSNPSTGTTVPMTTANFMKGVTGIDVNAPFLPWDAQNPIPVQTKKFLFWIIAMFLIVSSMMAFMEEVPKVIGNFIADATVPRLLDVAHFATVPMGQGLDRLRKGLVTPRPRP